VSLSLSLPLRVCCHGTDCADHARLARRAALAYALPHAGPAAGSFARGVVAGNGTSHEQRVSREVCSGGHGSVGMSVCGIVDPQSRFGKQHLAGPVDTYQSWCLAAKFDCTHRIVQLVIIYSVLYDHCSRNSVVKVHKNRMRIALKARS